MSGKYIKDPSWQTVYTAVAGQLSNTFGSSTRTQEYFPTRGAVAVKYRLNSVTLPAAGEIRITPKFRAKDGSTTDTPADGSTNIYYPLVTAGTSSEPFGEIDAWETTAEVWLDSADAGAACVVQMKRIYPT